MSWFTPAEKALMKADRQKRYRQQKDALDARKAAALSRSRASRTHPSQAIPINARLNANLRSRIRPYVSDTTLALKLLGCSIEELKTHLEQKFTFHRVHGAMTWENYGLWELDHLKPLASFDLSEVDQLAIALHFTNLQPLWRDENSAKSDLFVNFTRDNEELT